MATDVELGRIATVKRAQRSASPTGRQLSWPRILALLVNLVAWGLIISAANWALHRGH
jgi:hypothetical protein